ncbi:cysteine hydrolase family protein [Kitasatospora sp. NBC_00458]|uniref:cysteine hydrolase family protein n=1 Tax=Kitasatospora sp. NBC_00458 TaxID=2903568 RepID=UPI002E16EEB5
MNSALVVIDVQESFRQRANWAAVSNPGVVGQVRRLVEHTRAAGDLVVWVLHAEPGTGNVFDPALGHVRLIDGLAPAADEPVLTKTSHNAFTTTNLQQLLTERGLRALTVCGIRTEQCCETTARLAADLGYEVVFAVDATATHPIEHRDAPPGRTLDEILADPRTLGTDEIVARTEYALAGRFARIATVDELVAPAAHPAGATPAGHPAAAADPTGADTPRS